MNAASIVCVAVVVPVAASAATPTAELVCGERSPCRVVKEVPAGETAMGGRVTVVEVALHDRTGESWKEPAREGECAPWEVWTIPT